MRIKDRTFKKHIKYLDKNKKLVGLTDWHIFMRIHTKQMEDLAEVIIDDLEKILKITLSDTFLTLTQRSQKNILLHELLHARVNLMTKQQEKGDNEYFEELFVNDIVRGFERHKEL